MKKVILIKQNKIKQNKNVMRKISDSYHVVNFLTEKNCKNLSVAVGKAKNHFETTKNIKSNRVYYVLNDKLIVMQEKKKYITEKGDVIFIPKNTKYQFQGTFEAILINSPAFNSENEKIFV